MGADFLFDVAAVEAHLSASRGRIEPKGQKDPIQSTDQPGFIESTFPVDELLAQSKEGHRTVHGARIDVQVIQGLGEPLGQGALAGGAQAVDGDADAFHGQRSVRRVRRARWVDAPAVW